MSFALICMVCKSPETNLHIDGDNGTMLYHCLNCGHKQELIIAQREKPVTIRDKKTMERKEAEIRKRASKVSN